MKSVRPKLLQLLGLFLMLKAGAAVRYVDVNSTNPAPPYVTWATAANVMQDAVDVANAGDEIVVTDGIYATGGRSVYGTMTNRVAVDKPLILRSLNGPQTTVIQGKQIPGTTNGDGAIRCVYLTNFASLIGFTLTNGATRILGDGPERFGGGVVGNGAGIVSNCVIIGNSAAGAGGGVWGATLADCTLKWNSSESGGGAYASVLTNCTLFGNSARWGGGGGNATLNYCTVISNSASYGGGADYSILTNCMVKGNTGWIGGGASYGSLYNCVLFGNSAGGTGGATSGSYLINCTAARNSGYSIGGVDNGTLINCIVYNNSTPNVDTDSTIKFCCITPLRSGEGNFTNSPQFVNLDAGDLRLQSNSPCINSGLNAYAKMDQDLNGNPRVVANTVDVGAYEFQTPATLLSVAWALRYGIPINGSGDFADNDGDGHSNWHEWRAGTLPTNRLSALRMLLPNRTAQGTIISWESVTGRVYQAERATNLVPPLIFSTLATNLVASASIRMFTDTNAVGAGSFFYRVRVQQ